MLPEESHHFSDKIPLVTRGLNRCVPIPFTHWTVGFFEQLVNDEVHKFKLVALAGSMMRCRGVVWWNDYRLHFEDQEWFSLTRDGHMQLSGR